MPIISSPQPDPRRVALETTLLVHGIPRERAIRFHRELSMLIEQHGGLPTLIGVVDGRATIGMNEVQLQGLLGAANVAKANTGNLGVLMHNGAHAATTVSATMELAASAGIRIFATGGLGGVHKAYGTTWDISADLAALARYPVAVIASGVKSLLDVAATREALETFGIPVIGWGTDRFPAFYLRESDAGVDARFDDVQSLSEFVRFELERTGRGLLIANPIPAESQLDPLLFEQWLEQARAQAIARGASGRSVTPAILAALHELSEGATLRANLDLVRSNAELAARIAALQAH